MVREAQVQEATQGEMQNNLSSPIGRENYNHDHSVKHP